MRGFAPVSGAKNAALPIFAATLLAPGVYNITNVPELKDISIISKLLVELGSSVERTGDSTYRINSDGVSQFEAPYDLVKTMRASCLVLGPLLVRLKRAKVSLPGGCAIGSRPLDQHVKGLEALGADITLDHGNIEASSRGALAGRRIAMDVVTVTGTMNIMMAATKAKGVTVIENAAEEPEVAALAIFLNRMGANIEGAGSAVITIKGVDQLTSADIEVMPDRIEAGTFMAASAITKGDIIVGDIDPESVAAVTEKLRAAGCEVTESEHSVRVIGPDIIRSVDITTAPFPGFPTDMQAQFMALMTLADGASVISETIFENRFMHVAELRRMGADIAENGSTAIVRGVSKLSAAPLMATDLRASASLVLAGLAGDGETSVSRVYHLDRGYEHIEKKFEALGAVIKRVRAD